MWQKLVLQVIAYGIIILFILYKVFMPVARFQKSVKKIIEINRKISGFMCENPYLIYGGRVNKEKKQKDLGLLLKYSYQMKDELKRAFVYYEQIPLFMIKLCKFQTLTVQMYQLVDAINQAIWKVKCNL